MNKRILLIGAAVIVAGALLIQAAPYGRSHKNPPVMSEPPWDSPRTRDLAVRACFDCHSNETAWPWYSNVAPVSWLVQNHVDEGRAALNFSEWTQPRQRVRESSETVAEGEMPPAYYYLFGAHKRLTDAEKQELVTGLTTSLTLRARAGSLNQGLPGLTVVPSIRTSALR